MATKTTRAANAQRRATKAQKRKANAKQTKAKAAVKNAKASVNNFSNPKTSKMGQTNTIGVMVQVKTKSGLDNFIAFETDNEEFLPIYNVVSKREHLEILHHIWGAEIVLSMEKQLTPNHEFSMMVLNYLCTTKHRQCIANNDGASFGVVIDLDETKSLAAVELFEYEEWQSILEMKSKKGVTKFYN